MISLSLLVCTDRKRVGLVQDIWLSVPCSYWHTAYRKCKLLLKKSLPFHLFLLYFKGSSQCCCYLFCLAVSVKFLTRWASGSLLETPSIKRDLQCLLFSHIVLDSDLSCFDSLCLSGLSDLLDMFHLSVVTWDRTGAKEREGRERDVSCEPGCGVNMTLRGSHILGPEFWFSKSNL